VPCAGTSGLGLASAKALAKKGAHVIVTARSQARGEQVLKELASEFGALGGGGAGDNSISSFADGGTGKIEFGICEHEDLRSIKAFALWFLSKGLKLDVLMLNAGIAIVPYKLVHGVESQLFTNHIAHHYLTSLLLQRLKDTRPSRVVVVSSAIHEFSSGMLPPSPAPEEYSGWKYYANSKLANIHFTRGLAQRLASHRVFVNAVHPGIPQPSTLNPQPATCNPQP
jgi:NAD(P)-dependent dehydrogenase (short-subunit alcohol dehydrogenase family)